MPVITEIRPFLGESLTFSGGKNDNLYITPLISITADGAMSFSGKLDTSNLVSFSPLTALSFVNNNLTVQPSVGFSGALTTSFVKNDFNVSVSSSFSGALTTSFVKNDFNVSAPILLIGGPTNGLATYLDAADPSSYTGTAWNDLSTFGNNATIVTGPTFNSTDSSLYYNGTSRTTIPRTVSNDFSLLCWFRTTSTNGSSTGHWWAGGPLVDGEVAGVATDFGLSIGNGIVMFGVGNPDTTIKSTSSYNDGIWHCAVATRIALTGAIKLYVDGVETATGTGNISALTASSVLNTGTGANASTFVGNISIIQVYNRTLSATEVSTHFADFKTRFGV